ncbi:MAG: DNA repair protein RadC [Bacteroidales bacterium]|nr:DNA repair protein RadC [Bacteroidales bacterium]
MPYRLTKTSFTTLADDQMPREKALAGGIRSLTDIELMAILFGTGLKGVSVLEMSQGILDDNDGHLSLIADMKPDEFSKRYKGIGPAKALTLLAGIELGLRAAHDAANMPKAQITSSKIAYDLMRPQLERLDHEEFWVLLLNNAATVISKEFIASGGQTSTVVDIRILMRRALDNKATRMILFHNHPSGNLRPSMQDDSLTKKIKEAAALFDIKLDDHIIISPASYYSYNDMGRI